MIPVDSISNIYNRIFEVYEICLENIETHFIS